ncbi:MAG: hypothetical protein M5T61_20290, partial [Acidimicrobiia bacterium]|nr:hypothetical protein [Acidimicrobiia bacterium]
FQANVNVAYVKRVDTAVLGTAGGSVKIEDEMIFKLGLGLTPGVPGMIFILETELASRVNRFFEDETTRLTMHGGVRYRFENGLGLPDRRRRRHGSTAGATVSGASSSRWATCRRRSRRPRSTIRTATASSTTSTPARSSPRTSTATTARDGCPGPRQ